MSMDKRKYKQLLLPLLLMVLVLIGGGGCSDDEDPAPMPEDVYNIIELNMDDHRFEDLRTITVLKDVEFQSGSDSFGFAYRNDSLFIEYFGSLLYPIRLPSNFPVYGNPFILSGMIKKQPDGADYHPLILEGFKYELLQEM